MGREQGVTTLIFTNCHKSGNIKYGLIVKLLMALLTLILTNLGKCNMNYGRQAMWDVLCIKGEL